MPLTSPKGLRAAERDAARYMALDGVARSDASVALCHAVSVDLFTHANIGKRGKPTSAHEQAVAALLCDLLRNAEGDPANWGFRSHRAIEFTGKAVGYRVYMSAFRGLLDQGALEFKPGHQQHIQFSGVKVSSWLKAPRVRATASGLSRAASSGITPENWQDHFEIVTTRATVSRKPPLVCRSPSSRMGATKAKGASLPIDRTDPTVLRLEDQVKRINAFVANHDIVGANHSGFQRIFHADEGGRCRWDKGGRLYSVDHENYQRAKKASRAKMTINGQAVVELDLTASHLTILHALRGRDFDPSNDPYAIEGIPREVVKKWVTMTLGHHQLHRSWSKGARDDLDEMVGGSLVQAFPIGRTRAAILERIPLLADWAESPYRWGDLQYLESEVILRTVGTLAFSHGVPCLPVHDSIIVPAADRVLASKVLSDAFRSTVGVTPHLKLA